MTSGDDGDAIGADVDHRRRQLALVGGAVDEGDVAVPSGASLGVDMPKEVQPRAHRADPRHQVGAARVVVVPRRAIVADDAAPIPRRIVEDALRRPVGHQHIGVVGDQRPAISQGGARDRA